MLASIGELNARRGTRLAQRWTPPFVVQQAAFLSIAPAIEVGVIEFTLGAVGSFHRKDELRIIHRTLCVKDERFHNSSFIIHPLVYALV